ncbi:methyl-accepting chemotaxis protein [Brachyspira hyodysenteriae]|uniref:methyl-accepting chemotaxis protein n=1 Tax=Brachyspira hyodysenteriae TaxID=159 RepID=UPI0022CD95C6|nr:methyl-accepting chemotaxis protein [Brachyspira hyodysenteriae]MCZ9876972.1 methyl-accepting chemotaxis protein [Brachyspira hyodysenteriae]MCZ9933545.1 methyl-accepting chemotaxis protein [Brachyspira hyodysenteriae]MCZ9944885.1 methyl-accepting chemotaxis protein [Brachyspira hyodysenteriae]MCZ9946732.1 methyl-accepting chemotaxis protein [Brachyspira hyodysenteriae]MCZ9967088.1 methyl-accepting chemotaxis protein [Brachyspira hyodysenteriae]
MRKIHSIRVKMPIAISILSTIFLVLIVAILSYRSHAIVKNSTLSGFDNTVNGYKDMLDVWLDDSRNLIKTYAVSPIVRNYLVNREIDIRSTLTEFEAINEYVLDIGITDTNGIILDNVNSVKIGENITTVRPNILNILKKNNNEASFDDSIQKSSADKKWSLAVICGVKYNGEYVGNVYMIMDWEDLAAKLQELKLPERTRIFAIDDDNTVVLDTKNEINTEANEAYGSILKGGMSSGVMNYISSVSHDPRTAVYSRLENLDWYLIMAMDDKVIYKANNDSIIISIIICILSIIFINVFAFLYIKKVTHPLKVLMQHATSISEGNINAYIKDNYGKDEFGQLEKVFDVMSSRLAEVVSNVNNASREIMTAAQSMMESSNELSVRTDSQSSSLEETAASIEEMVSNIKTSTEKSLLGKDMMSESMQYIENAASIIAQTASNIEEVYQASEKIKDITKIIEDIAFQTNILALNASVEAARAGDQGKGFAVVASEVRNLAQTTQASVKDITELVDNTSQKIDTATQTAKQSQEIFVDLQNKVSDTSKLMETITSNALEQESGTNQISIEVNNMETATTQNAALAENSNEISRNLVEKAEFLERSIEFFKISHNR